MTAHPAATSVAPGEGCAPARDEGWSSPSPSRSATAVSAGYDVIADPGRLRQPGLAVLGEGG